VEVCPGNLIKLGEDKKAAIRRVKDCWGCTSCIKECKVGAIQFFLGADMGGRGSRLSCREEKDQIIWKVERPDGSTDTIEINKRDANKY
jgi:adenylylsulfate reductase subunit B